jgi:hypothetical protein
MRPSGETAVASWIINEAPPTALLPRWTKCQSLANPSIEEYWHIGDTTNLFFKVTPLILNGEMSFDIIEILIRMRY